MSINPSEICLVHVSSSSKMCVVNINSFFEMTPQAFLTETATEQKQIYTPDPRPSPLLINMNEYIHCGIYSFYFFFKMKRFSSD